MLALRNSQPVSELDDLSSEIDSRLVQMPEILAARTISTYINTRSEVRTTDFIKWALSNSKRVIIPITDKANRRLVFSEVKDLNSELAKGAYGIMEPKIEFRRRVALEEANIVIIPGVAWDRSGFRIGYGAGYYDRSINALRTRVLKIGLAYEFQLVPNVPKSRYDRRVDKIVTERRIIITTNTGL